MSGHVVMPGFVDTHRHTWQTPFRGVCADWTLEDYFRGIRTTISPNCSADDVYAGNHLGALEALDAGVTTILDFSHCNNTPEHADAALQGLRDAGIRALFAYGYYPAPSPEPGFADHDERLADARRIRERELPADDGLVTMGLALTEVGLLPFEQTIAEVRSAGELGVPTVLHTGCSWGSAITEGIPELDHHGLLGAEQVHVHCNTLDDRDFRRLADNGCKVSSSPETEIQMGMGHPVIRRALEHGMRPSLSCDVMSSNSGDMFSQMRIGLQFERCMRNDTFNARNLMPDTLDLTVRDALRWAHRQRRARGRARGQGRLAHARQAGGHDRDRRQPAEPRADGGPGRLPRRPGQRRRTSATCWWRGASRSATASWWAWTCIVPCSWRREASERVLGTVAAGGELLPPAPEGFADMLNTFAARNLARAWAIEPA